MFERSTVLAMVMMPVFSSGAMAASVQPVLIDDFHPGDAFSEVAEYCPGTDFAYKIDNDTSTNPTVETDEGNTIVITNSDGYTFDWESAWPVACVIVKAGAQALIYHYPNAGSYSDTDLRAPEKTNQQDNDNDGLINEDPIDGIDNDGDGMIDEDSVTTGEGRQISHVTFGYNEPDMCYEEETAWAEGQRYVPRGNWAMYVDYSYVEKTVELIADYSNYVHAGTVTFSAPVGGYVTITATLTGGAIFYYDASDPLFDNNLKVQDYDTAPTKTPSPGLFAWKKHIETGSTTGSIVVPANNFYGVHIDLALPVACSLP